MSTPAIAVVMMAAITTSRKLRWMPGRCETNSLTPMWTPSPLLIRSAKPDASQPIVYAPIAKNAT